MVSIIFKIDFEKAFSRMDSDHIIAVGFSDNKLYIQWHHRNKIIYPIEGDPLFIKAHDEMFCYKCKDKEEASQIFSDMTNNNAKKIWYDLMITRKELIKE